jgi:hypothetical protein
MRAQVANIVGPGYGEIYCLVADRDDAYGKLLRKRGVTLGSIFTTLAEAEDKMVTDQNDTLLVFPGNHAVTASILWDKDATNIIGVGSPNQGYQPSTLTNGGVRIKCDTATVAEILDITGNYVSIYGIGTQNTANDSTNVCDLRIRGKNTYLKLCALRGGTGAAQVAAEGSGLPIYVDQDQNAGAGNALWVDTCQLGSSGNTARTVGTSCLMSHSASGAYAGGFGMHFTDCVFSMISSTAGVFCVNFPHPFSIDRDAYFKRCLFYCYGTAAAVDYVFNTGSNNTDVVLDSCVYHNFDYWAAAGSHVYVACGPANIGPGGKSVVCANS